MTVRGARSSKPTRERGRLLRLVRGSGRRCDFCGVMTNTIAVVAGWGPTGAMICPSCVERAALQLFRPGGGDAG